MATLDRPGVEVLQEQGTTSVTAARPTLVPCIVGPLKEIIEHVDSTGAANTKAEVNTPAIVLGSTGGTTKAVSAKGLGLRIDNGAQVDFEFPTSSSGNIANNLVVSLLETNFPGAKFELIGTDVRITSNTTGGNSSIEVKAPAAGTSAVSSLGLTAFQDRPATGASRYTNSKLEVPFNKLPVDRGDADQMTLDTDSISVFRKVSGKMQQFKTDAAFLTSRKRLATTTIQGGMVALTGTNPEDADAITVYSRPGVNASAVSIVLTGGGTHPIDGTDVDVTANTTGGGVIDVSIETGVSTATTIAAALNANTSSNALVVAYDNGTGGGTVTTQTVKVLSHRSVSLGLLASKTHVGTPSPDADTDGVTTNLFGAGADASTTIGTDTFAITYTAKGIGVKPFGDKHGATGNSLTVTYTGGGTHPIDSTDITVNGGTDIVVDLEPGVSTADTVVSAIASHTTANTLVTAVAAGNGAIPATHLETNLHGGFDPFNMEEGATACHVLGERTAAHFKMDFLHVDDVTGFGLGDSVKKDDTNGVILGVVQEIDANNNRLYLDVATKTLNGVLSSGDTIFDDTGGSATATVTEHIGAGMANGDSITISFDGKTPHVINFAATDDTLSEVVTAIDAVVGAGTAFSVDRDTVDVTNPKSTAGHNNSPTTVLLLVHEDTIVDLTSPFNDAATFGTQGTQSTITITGNAAEKLFGLMLLDNQATTTYVGSHEGVSNDVKPGDAVSDGATSLGTVVKVSNLSVGANTFGGSFKGMLELSSDTLSESASFSGWHVEAKGLAAGNAGRPEPALVVDTVEQQLEIAPAQARNSDGTVATTPSFKLYADYEALRTDVTPKGTNPKLFAFNSTTELDNLWGPLNTKNPLAFGVYSALLNAPTIQISAVGVDATSTQSPDGTFEAYERAFDFLESKEVYAVAPLTHNRHIHTILNTHLVAMSAKTEKKERIGFVNLSQQTEKEATLVGSSTNATLTGLNQVTFDLDDTNVVDAMNTAGVDPSGSPSDLKAAGVYINITSDNNNYLVQSVSGQVVTLVVTGFDPGENDDSFFAATNLDPNSTPAGMDPTGETATIKIRGADIDASTTTGKNEQIAALGAVAKGHAERRLLFVQPDQVGVSVNGVEQTTDGFFACAATAGLVGQLHPAQPFTQLALTGINSVKGSSDKFTEGQMATAAADGVYWLVQDTDNGPVVCRHQLSTDSSSIEKRELSITKALDFGAKYLRSTFTPYIGKYNITSKFLDSLSTLMQGALRFLVDDVGLWRSASLNSLQQDTDKPDVIEADISVTPLYPANTIRITLRL